MQKIVFLALGYAETRFKSLGEEISSFNSSKSIYKGREFHQLTGTRDGNGFYNSPGPYENYATAVGNQNIISHPDLICKNIHYAIDSAGWFWTDPNMGKKVPLWSSSSNVKYIKFRANYFSKALGKPLNEVSHLVEDDEKYFWLQAKLLNGYPKGEKLEIAPNGWKTRKNAFDILKNNVFEFNIRCKGDNNILEFNGKWHDPVDNPQITMYMQSGGYWPKYAAFGYTRKQTRKPYGQHQGLDLFALDDGNTNVYACLSGKIVFASTSGGYGKLIVLEVTKNEQLKIFRQRKRDYTLRYKNEGEESKGNGFLENSDKIYLRYAHLSKILVSVNDEVVVGQIIGVSGTTGVPGGTCGPHVHFEIASSLTGSMIQNRVNPGYYIYYKNENDLTDEEKLIQKKRMEKGKK